MNEEQIKKLTIYEKMNLIIDEIGVIEKNLNVDIAKNRSYKAVSERDVIDSIKPLEKKYRVFSYPCSRDIIDKDVLIKENDYGKSSSLFLRMKTIYRFINIDNSSEFLDIISYGDGIDTGDKSPGKAMTYSDKYALMKMYKLSTGDDPDKEASPQKGYTNKKVEKQDEERLNLIVQFEKLVLETGTNKELIYETYKVNNNTEMSNKQLEQAINHMKKKKENKVDGE